MMGLDLNIDLLVMLRVPGTTTITTKVTQKQNLGIWINNNNNQFQPNFKVRYLGPTMITTTTTTTTSIFGPKQFWA